MYFCVELFISRCTESTNICLVTGVAYTANKSLCLGCATNAMSRIL